ncbi:P-loop NTPase fold protein [Marinobacter sp. AN1]|uniref:YobI family P-loop NTPase n=1 Tax=Marinobacter sp. AN1 TaxID=2886046 RepID=UPI002230B8D3|nr:P-loop NTPase fold protein [Marinobacter sp. AN1]UZD64065.1 P-loop NTPase fold protein [Marinobacter sp. AN1]
MSSHSGADKTWGLLPLTPEFIEKEHGGYLKALQQALKAPQIRNIALSGRYGVGKSSILQELARSQKSNVVELSLSTLAPLADEGLDDAVPKQAKTTTNRIQQEIVKQLLYREKPSKTPGSRFRRIERFSLFRELVLAGLAGSAIAVVGLLTGWTSQIDAALLPNTDLGRWSHGIILAVGIVVTSLVRCALYGRIQIRQLSAGAATVTLDDHSVSYFDQYLDEIVYFFEVSKRNIVIFEDIDRFNNARIFETLLALNTLLNTQRPDDNPIRFIYAIKDSIFDQSKFKKDEKPDVEAGEDPAQAEAVRANRTKFFDLVIPVVPFITHRSAKNLAWGIVKDLDSEVGAALTDLAARYIPDMRLIKNVRNEFIVFRDRIFSGSGADLALRKTELFAMMLYKCTHLADFEAISLGKSDIDEIYQAERNLVSLNINRIQREIRQARNKLETVEYITTESESLGDKLLRHIERTVRSARHNSTAGEILFNGKPVGEGYLRTSQFWQEFTQIQNDQALVWRFSNISLVFPRSDIKEVLNNSLNPDRWNEQAEEQLKDEIDSHLEDLRFLRGANMSDLITRPEFTVEYDEEPKSFDEIVRSNFVDHGLAYELIRNGYINRNFTLYTATYHGNRVSAAAQNFIMLHVERDLMDEHFELDGPDVDAVIRECGSQSLAEPALYNVAILDHLLIKKNKKTADIMIGSLVQFGERQQRFVQAYLNNATERAAFVERFTAFAPDVLKNLVENIELADSERLEFVSRALGSIPKNLEYHTNKPVRAYLIEHYTEFPVLTSESISTDNAERIARIYAASKIQVSALEPLTSPVKRVFVNYDCYAITRENLAIALESDTELTLDRAKEKSEVVYRRLLQDLPDYLSAIEGTSFTVGTASYFASVIEDVIEADANQLNKIIAAASNDCVVDEIKDVSEEAWPHLAQHGRFPITFTNVDEYVEVMGEVDAYLARLLDSSNAIIEHKSGDEEHKEALALKILATDNSLLSASSRVRLVVSLQLENYLSVDSIEVESGELFGLLLRENEIADCAKNYIYLSETDWPTREQFIEQSGKFHEYMTPDLVGGDVAELLRSERVSIAVKEEIVSAASEYAESCDYRGLTELARYAAQNDYVLAPELVEKMAANQVSERNILQLLRPNLNSMPYDQLARTLRYLGENYISLTSPGRDQPKFPDTDEDRELLDKLKEYGYVVSNIKSARGGRLKVTKRHKAN